MHARFLVKSLFVAAVICGATATDASACFFFHRWNGGGCCPEPCCPTPCCATPCCEPLYAAPSCCGTAYQPVWGSPYASRVILTSGPRVASYRSESPYRSVSRSSVNGYTTPVRQTYQPAQPVYVRTSSATSPTQVAQLEGRRYLFGRP